MKKLILLIEDDAKTEAAIKELLESDYALETAAGQDAAREFIKKKKPDLIIIDFDLKGEDGLHIHRVLQPRVPVIMLSASGNIPLAVSATKLGVSDFLRKPLHLEALKEAVKKGLSLPGARIRWDERFYWLRGESRAIASAVGDGRDILLAGERGIQKRDAAELIHLLGPKKERRLVVINLAAFGSENLEAHFWATLQKLLRLPDAVSLRNEKDLCGTIYLENIEGADETFRLSVLNFFRERRGNIDRSVRAVIAVTDMKARDFFRLELPPLRGKKEDLPYLLAYYLKQYSGRYNKDVRLVSAEALDYLFSYDYPGNYVEFERMVQAAVLNADTEKLEMKDLPVESRGLRQTAVRRGEAEDLTLEEARRKFERSFYAVLLDKAGGDRTPVSNFLDVPQTVLSDRLQDLAD